MGNGEETLVVVDKIKQYGDNFLIHCSCPVCGEECLTPFNKFFCCVDHGTMIYDISAAESILVVGTMRKARFSKKIISKKLKEQNYKCAYCIKNIASYFEVEHIIPIAAGGTNTEGNVCLSCRRCNQIAGSKVFSSFEHKLNHIINRRLEKGWNED